MTPQLPSKKFSALTPSARLVSAFLIFLVVLWKPLPSAAEDLKSTSAAELIKWLLADPERLENIPFSDVIMATSGKKIIPMDDKDPVDQAILKHIEVVGSAVMATLNAPTSPIKKLRRINEASKYFEDALVEALTTGDFICNFPHTEEGSIQRSGYPDLELLHKPSGKVTYLDPKLFEETSRNSSFRTFYFEPKLKTNKVTKDAHQLLLGFSHDGKDGDWTFVKLDLVDVSKLSIRLKAEFEASNKQIYKKENIVGSEKAK